MTKNFCKITLFFAVLSLFVLTQTIPAQKISPKASVEQIVKSSNGTIGVAIVGLEDNFSLNVNGDKRFPMQSVFKFPLAVAVLDQVDKGKLALDQKIRVTKSDLLPNTWSPLREANPDGGDILLSDLLKYTVSQSDNNGCDILFRLLGGAKSVGTYVNKNLGVKDIAIVATEEEMAKDERVQFTNWSKPTAMLRLMVNSYQGKYLSKSSNDFLWKIMAETSTGVKRIKGSLPEGTIVAHKTGTSGTNDKGVATATNDAGIVTLPDGKHFAIVVYVSNSTDDEKKREAVIAQISKVVWDYYLEKTPNALLVK
ncbi:MAG: class A beta-lactamase, subclass A2 [Pyrinomonadaceae bacterium]|nr:class A beta-lactamase, subclass A2 [Pyrinomonadaceae bacterium]